MTDMLTRDHLAPLVPTPEQQAAINKMAGSLWETGGALQASDLGVGKTLMLVEVALNLKAQTVLISAPLHTRFSWQDTVERQSGYAIPFLWINNSTKAGKAALESLKRGDAGYYFVSRELFRLIDWRGVRIDLVAHDECQTIARRENKGYKVAFDLRQRTKYTICQSATWYGASFENAWGIGRILWPEVVERNYYRWILKYCKTVYDSFATNQQKVVGERNPGAFVADIPCYVNLRSNATQPPMFEDIFVDLSARQRKLYNEFEERGVVWLSSHPMIATVPVVQRIRLRQIALAECDVTDDDAVVFRPNAKSSKFDALKDLLSTLPENEKVVIVTDSAKFARMVAARLGSDAFAWTGEATQKERERAKGRFVKGDLKYLVAVQKAISEGTDSLQLASHILVVLSEDDSVVQNQQMCGRLNRRGQTERVLVYTIRARQTVEDKQAVTLLGKEVQMRASMLKDREEAAA